jgi:2-polyprenyl-6-hydroxyphenyl methylase/3-demethylubiquinone-9 3-methyltransferase
MTSYYAQKLAGRRLERCYALASPRVQEYLEAEIRHVLARLGGAKSVLELGCGYGRVALRLPETSRLVIGIDVALASLALGRGLASRGGRCPFVLMDAVRLAFAEDVFDAVVCVQNGICAFRVDQERLLAEALRVVRPGGQVLISTYADRFWACRLEWFEAQASAGLVGPIDHAQSRDGVIVCSDGFRSGRLTPDELAGLAHRLHVPASITEVDGSCVFCEITKPQRRATSSVVDVVWS